MKKIFYLLLSSLLMVSLYSCSSDDDPIDNGTVTIESELSLIIGQEATLIAQFSNDVAKNKEYDWTLDNDNIIKIESFTNKSCKIVGLTDGESKITIKAKDGSISSTCNITVTQGNISFNISNDAISINETLILKLEFSDEFLKSKKYNYVSSNPNIVDIKINEDHSIMVIGKGIGETKIEATSEDGTVMTSCFISVTVKNVKKWVALGNSITKHGITPFWWGEWGMAATIKEKDYVHVLNSLFEEEYKTDISFDAVNIAAWERDFKGFNKESIKSYFSGNEDIVLIRLGENVPSNEAVYSVYKEELTSLVEFLKEVSPKATYVITGNFWKNDKKDAIQKEVAGKYNCIWVPLSQFDNAENKSTLDTKVFGDDGKWHTISEGGATAPGVANHPGDLGMKNIATAIYNSIKGK